MILYYPLEPLDISPFFSYGKGIKKEAKIGPDGRLKSDGKISASPPRRSGPRFDPYPYKEYPSTGKSSQKKTEESCGPTLNLLKEKDYIMLLTKELANNNYISLVISERLLGKLEKDSYAFMYVLADGHTKYLRSVASVDHSLCLTEPSLINDPNNFEFFMSLLPAGIDIYHKTEHWIKLDSKEGTERAMKYENIISRKLAEYCMMLEAKKLGVNYVFIENSKSSYHERSCITTLEGLPFARIGSSEIEQIVNIDKFETDYQTLQRAFTNLGIEREIKDTLQGNARFYPSDFIKRFRNRDDEGQKRMLEAILPMLDRRTLPTELLEEFRLEHYAYLFKDMARDEITKESEGKDE